MVVLMIFGSKLLSLFCFQCQHSTLFSISTYATDKDKQW